MAGEKDVEKRQQDDSEADPKGLDVEGGVTTNEDGQDSKDVEHKVEDHVVGEDDEKEE